MLFLGYVRIDTYYHLPDSLIIDFAQTYGFDPKSVPMIIDHFNIDKVSSINDEQSY